MNSLSYVVELLSACKKPAETMLYWLILTSYAVTECMLHSSRKICRLISMLSHAGENRPCKAARSTETSASKTLHHWAVRRMHGM